MIKSVVTAFLDFVDNRAIIHRGVLIFTLCMTFWATYSAWEFAVIAVSLKYDGLGIAAIITAVMAPTAALQGFAFRDYSEMRKAQKKESI